MVANMASELPDIFSSQELRVARERLARLIKSRKSPEMYPSARELAKSDERLENLCRVRQSLEEQLWEEQVRGNGKKGAEMTLLKKLDCCKLAVDREIRVGDAMDGAVMAKAFERQRATDAAIDTQSKKVAKLQHRDQRATLAKMVRILQDDGFCYDPQRLFDAAVSRCSADQGSDACKP